ncbi:methyl-accepting chemotaxis protein [Rhizobium sp. CRIBSB]|nr:methyl-accepting chemotaxis protein [Rhizobium sp. CRIBSB]
MIFQARDLAHQRAIGGIAIVVLGWILAGTSVVQAVLLKTDLLAGAGPGVALALLQTANLMTLSGRPGSGGMARMLSSILLMAQVSILVAGLSGNALQIDMHMAYFAALAVVVIYSDWKAIIGGAATVAVHHLVLSFVLPELVFPGSADLFRVVFHAVILIIEAAVLAWSAASVTAMFAANARSQAAAEEATAQALAAAAAAETSRIAAETATGQAMDSASALEVSRAAADRLAAEAMERDLAVAREQALVVEQTAAGLSALARGDLTYRIPGRFPGSYAKLQEDFNSAMDALQSDLSVIDANARTIRAEAGEISHAADDLSRRTEQQAATLEQTAAALEEITATVRLAARGADDASSVMVQAQSEADQSRPIITDAVDAMSDIESSSEQISQIIGVIDEIAFQTNLLALNAGVEAARAGDAGRGFAVVASEVRALAQRSAEAAKEIKTLISTSRSQVQNGVVLVGKTGVALEAIAARVNDISGIMVQITASTREQATAMEEINLAINQMDQTTQQNAAMVEQSTAACQSLTNDAAQLADLVSRFQLGEAGRQADRRHQPGACYAA